VTRRLPGTLACAIPIVLSLSCGGSPNAPGGTTQPPPAQTNQPPTIESITIGSERAEVGDRVTVNATVRDPETPVADLQYAWSADAGTFEGQGASVVWLPPAERATPAEYTMRLTVTETYGVADTSGVRPKNIVTATSTASVRVHNSPREVGDLSLGFLRDFATSAIPADVAVRDFSDNCPGKAEERGQIANNRHDYEILASSLNLRDVSVAGNRLSANSRVACAFTSRVKACQADRPECVVGSTEKVAGNCVMTARYEQRRWWLCDSHFVDAVSVPLARAFFGEGR
jgi:hypothetical protein